MFISIKMIEVKLPLHKISDIMFLSALFYSSRSKNPFAKFKSKVVNVAIIGAPNSGKSTLINNIVNREICAASTKAHTTRNLARAMCFEEDTHIIFLDTPGIVGEEEQTKYKLPESMVEECKKSLKCADVVGVMHDVTDKWSKERFNRDVIKMLKLVDKKTPCCLILNKVDALNNQLKIRHIIKSLTNNNVSGVPQSPARKSSNCNKGYSNFSEIFLTSALYGQGIIDFKNYLLSNAKEQSMQFSPFDWTDQPPKSLVEQTVRAKCLDFLPLDVSKQLDIRLEYFDDIPGEGIDCSVVVTCPTERLVRFIRGDESRRVEELKLRIINDLQSAYQKYVEIDIHLKAKRPKINAES